MADHGRALPERPPNRRRIEWGLEGSLPIAVSIALAGILLGGIAARGGATRLDRNVPAWPTPTPTPLGNSLFWLGSPMTPSCSEGSCPW